MSLYTSLTQGYAFLDNRDRNWLGHRLKDVLLPHLDKIQSNIYNNVGGWEAWLQFEMMYAFTLMTRAAADVALCTGLYDSVLSSFEREEIYQSSKQRADFMIRVCINESDTEAHYVEMKCRSSKEVDSAFVNRVEKDIDKVLNTEWGEWRTSEDAFSAWVIAVSASCGDGGLEKLMYEAGEKKGIKWQVIDFENEGNIKIWTYEKRVIGMADQLLFGYASQRALALYAKQGEKTERPEPCVEYESP